MDFSSAQFTKGFDDLRIRVYGASGTVDSAYDGDVRITGDAPWAGGSTKGLYTSGAVGQHPGLPRRRHRRPGVGRHARPSLQSNLAAILGRKAAYLGRTVTWDEMMKDLQRIDPKLQLPKDGPTSSAI